MIIVAPKLDEVDIKLVFASRGVIYSAGNASMGTPVKVNGWVDYILNFLRNVREEIILNSPI